jgi:hypothetical protein
LLEFAIAIPVLIAILYYLHDVPKYKRMQEKMNFAAHCIINMIQNTNKAVTASDVKRILYAWQSVIYPNPAEKLVYMAVRRCLIETDLFFVVGTGNDRCKVMWSARSQSGTPNRYGFGAPNNYPCYIVSNEGAVLTEAGSSVIGKSPARIKKETVSTALHPSLHIKAGEKKMILEVRYYIWSDSEFKLQEWFGFKILNPGLNLEGSGGKNCFDNIVIFTPKPGLFDETPPK